jgi:hypothetical protein
MYRIIGSDGREYGPISADQLRQWVAQGRANATTPTLAEGATEWKPLASIPGFSSMPFAPASTPAVFPSGPFPSQKNNPFALTGMILGIVSLTFGLCCCYGWPFSITGLIFSIIALGQIKSHPERYTGSGMAIAGIILCCLSLILFVALICFGVVGSLLDHPMRHAYRL